MSKKIFIVFGHNRYKSGSSFNAAIRDTFIDEAKKIGHEIDLINIYDEKQIKFWDGSKPDEQILDYRKRLEQADIMMIMSPCHNYIMNSAIQKISLQMFLLRLGHLNIKNFFAITVIQYQSTERQNCNHKSMTYGGPNFLYSAIFQQIPRRIKKWFLVAYVE